MSVTINVKLKRETDKAVLVEHGGEDIWLPKSQIDGPIPPVGQPGELDISDWIAEQKDLISSGIERYIAEQTQGGTIPTFVVKDTSTNPVRVVCTCLSVRDANIIAASLEMTKNKL